MQKTMDKNGKTVMSSEKRFQCRLICALKGIPSTVVRLLAMATVLTFLGSVNVVKASPVPCQIVEPDSMKASVAGTLHMYLVTDHGEKIKEIKQYITTGEDSFIAFVLESEFDVDMTQYFSKQELVGLKNDDGETFLSRFLIVPIDDLSESFSGKDFADMFAGESVRITGTFCHSDAGWRNIAPIALKYSRVEIQEDFSKYYYVLDDPTGKVYARAKELTSFVERLLHDETTFDEDLSDKVSELGISSLTSPDGRLKIYSWHDGDMGSEINHHSIFQTRYDGKVHAVFDEHYYQEPRKVYQVEASDGPVYLVEFFHRSGGWSYYIGVDAFSIDKEGVLQNANVFESVPALHNKTKCYLSYLYVECTPEPISIDYKGGWLDNFFFELTGRDIYMPHFSKESDLGGEKISDFYYHFEWDGDKFRYRHLEFNPILAKLLPEEGWLMEEFEEDGVIVRIDSVANGTYRYMKWKKDDMFFSAPELIITQGRYDSKKHEYHFKKDNLEYIYNSHTGKQRIKKTRSSK